MPDKGVVVFVRERGSTRCSLFVLLIFNTRQQTCPFLLRVESLKPETGHVGVLQGKFRVQDETVGDGQGRDLVDRQP